MMSDSPGTHENHPDLVGLTRSELSNDDALAAGDHLVTCIECRDELIELVVGSSLLRRASSLASKSSRETPTTEQAALPPLNLTEFRRRSVRRHLSLVAAAAMVIGATTGAAIVNSLKNGSDPATTQAVPDRPDRVVALGAIDPSDSSAPPVGEVQMVSADGGTAMKILTSGLPQAAADEFYEAWLLDPATNKMLPLGVVSGPETTFRVNDTLLGSYDAIDLSLESDDGDPQHSVTSVLRGSYADTTGD